VKSKSLRKVVYFKGQSLCHIWNSNSHSYLGKVVS